jgi:hypothetical protein
MTIVGASHRVGYEDPIIFHYGVQRPTKNASASPLSIAKAVAVMSDTFTASSPHTTLLCNGSASGDNL